MLKIALLFSLLGSVSIAANAQALPTATRLAEGQVGGGVILAHPDYGTGSYAGYGLYGDLDFKHHIGVEGEFHYFTANDIYERTYEIGARYSRHYGRFQPYGKFMVGRGVFNFPAGTANLAYNLYAYGGGTDIRIRPRINARVEFEQQKWSSDAYLPNGISPNYFMAGLAYRFK